MKFGGIALVVVGILAAIAGFVLPMRADGQALAQVAATDESMLLTGTMAWFTGPDAPVHFPGAAFVVSTLFGLACLLLLQLLPRAAQIPPSTDS